MSTCSHPDKLLIDHLNEVARHCKKVVQERSWLTNCVISQDIMANVAFLCGAFHDIGKATVFFQHYLKTLGVEQIGPKNHALISALFVQQIVRKYLNTTNLPFFEKELITTFSFTATKRHHGGLLDLEDEMYIKDKSKELKEIIDAFQVETVQEITDHFLKELSLSYDFSEFKSYIKSSQFEKDLPYFYEEEIKYGAYENYEMQKKIQYFYLHQLLYSTLLLSDKTDVIVDIDASTSNTFPLDAVNTFREKNGFNNAKSSIDEYKNSAYFESIKRLKDVYSTDQHIYSLTLPTGLGKTLISLGIALEIRKLNPAIKRLIVSIPFTSIIDQNFDVYKAVVNSEDSSILLKHHHQAEPAYKLGEEDLTPQVSQFLIETWQSEVVVTTFVQLLNSIFSNDKSLLMKLPNLANSIIILDEIQTIDYQYWKLINEVFTQIGSLLNCYFIVMSATQPLIFLPEKEIREIIPNYKSYFKLFNRTKIINKTASPISLDDFVNDVDMYAQKHPQKDILLILNTKRSCLAVYQQLKEVVDTDQCDLYFMSTSITPYERKSIIHVIKNKKSQKRLIVVTTQLIEAGVDISVDAVFRVLAPIDAIIQASGRANRYDEKGYPCDIFIYEIAESIKGSQMVYGNALLLKSKNVLNGIEEIEEMNYLSLIESYFNEIRKHSDSYSSTYLEHIQSLQFYKLGQFSLIEERLTESLFVQINQNAKAIWETYIDIYADISTSIFEKRLKFGRIKAQFYDFVVNIPPPKGEKTISFDRQKVHGFYLVEYAHPSPFYPYSEENHLLNIGYQDIKDLTY